MVRNRGRSQALGLCGGVQTLPQARPGGGGGIPE
jgi:hypothetical protein